MCPLKDDLNGTIAAYDCWSGCIRSTSRSLEDLSQHSWTNRKAEIVLSEHDRKCRVKQLYRVDSVLVSPVRLQWGRVLVVPGSNSHNLLWYPTLEIGALIIVTKIFKQNWMFMCQKWESGWNRNTLTRSLPQLGCRRCVRVWGRVISNSLETHLRW